MAPSTEIVIGDVGAQHVLIRPVARSSPGLFDNWDANGLICEVELAAGGFRAAFSADMRSEEFQAFMDSHCSGSCLHHGVPSVRHPAHRRC